MLLRLKIAATSATRSIILAELFASVETAIVLIYKIITDRVFEIK